MAYIGKTPVIGNFQKCDSIAVVNGQAAYTLQVGGTNVSPQSENHMLVSLNGILQAPVDSFTVSGSTLTFASNLITGDVIDFVMILGNVLDLGVPSDNTVSLAKLTATGTKDATTFLRGDNTFAEAGGGIENVTQFRITTDTNNNTNADITANYEVVDDASYETIGSAVTESSGVFSFPTTGKYLVLHSWYINASSGDASVNVEGYVTQDNSTYDFVSIASHGSSSSANGQATNFFLVDVTDTANVKVKFKTSSFTNAYIVGYTDRTASGVMFVRIGDT